MIIRSIKIKNFLSFRDYYKEFSDSVISIIGDNLSGKTALVEAIDYALTGSIRCSKEVDAIHHNEESMLVELVISDNDELYTIRRGRDINNKGLLEFNNFTKVKEAQAEIYKLIGMNNDEFKMTSFFNADNAALFMSLPSADKKKYLMKWLNNNHWDKLFECAKDDLKNLKDKNNKLLGKVSALKSSIREYNITEQEFNELNILLGVQKDKLEELNSKYLKTYDNANKLKYRIDKSEFKANSYKETIEEHKHELNRISTSTKKIKEYYEKIEKLSAIIGSKSRTKIEEKLENYNRIKLDLKIRIKEEEATFRVLNNNDYTGVCPVLNKPCGLITPDIKKIDKSMKKIKSLKSAYSKNDDAIILNSNLIDKFKEREILRDKLEELKKVKENIDSIKNKITNLNSRYDKELINVSEIQDKLSNLVISKKELKAKIDVLNSKIKVNENKVTVYKSILNNNKTIENKIDNIVEEIASLEAEIHHTAYLVNAFGKTGIPSFEIENSFSEIEDEINICMNELDDNITVEFSPDRQLSKKETKCICGFVYPKGYSKKHCKECGTVRKYARKDELSLKIVENDEIIEYSQLSGGGKMLTAFAVRIALMRLLHRRYNCKLNTLFFDEIDGKLDPDHIRRLTNFVKNVLINKFGYSQIFWISHNNMLKENAETTLKVIKQNGISGVVEL